MYNEDSMAAAQIAKIFGSELLRVQENARTDSGSSPQIVSINPKNFLVSNQNRQNNASISNNQPNKALIDMLQREAELAYPLPPPSAPPPPVNLDTNNQKPVHTETIENNIVRQQDVFTKSNVDILQKINDNLCRIANALEASNNK